MWILNGCRALWCLGLVCLFTAIPVGAAPMERPARAPVNGCEWQRLSDENVGLAAWVQRCDFGFRKVSLFFQSNALFVRYSDGGAPSKVIDVIDLLPGEAPQVALRRIFEASTPAAVGKRCTLMPYKGANPPADVQRFTFVPDAAYAAELAAKADPNEVPEPACGAFGEQPDGIQYFAVWPQSRARKLLFVRVGQDEPLFDEQTLQLLESSRHDEATASTVSEPACCEYRPGSNGISADFLLETCSVTGKTAHGMIPWFDCQSYILAVVDSYRALTNTIPDEHRICLPPTLTAQQVLDAMNGQYEFESDGQRRAAEVILEALRKRFACGT